MKAAALLGMANRAAKAPKTPAQPVEGEGSYTATRNYNKNLAKAVEDKQGIQRGAEQARKAVEGPEGEALRAAEKRAKAGPRASKR